jgi:hypothetical protein
MLLRVKLQDWNESSRFSLCNCQDRLRSYIGARWKSSNVFQVLHNVEFSLCFRYVVPRPKEILSIPNNELPFTMDRSRFGLKTSTPAEMNLRSYFFPATMKVA